MPRLTKHNLIAFFGVALLLATYFLFLAHPVNLVTADLGRHIRNGEHFIQNFEVIQTNFYSYTHPDFPVTNHHWGAGVLFYLLWSAFGFAGPQVFFIGLSLLTLFVFYKIARIRAGLGLSLLAGILVMPLLAERTEVRPEVFSYLFSGLFFYLLLKYRSNKIGFKKLLLILLPLQIIWVNTHIYFILGPAIVSAFLVESVIRKNYQHLKKYIIAIVSLFAASLINPFGFRGVAAPFTIFENFGYRLVENQTVWFLDRVLPQPNLLIFKIVFAVLVLSFLARMMRSRKGTPLESSPAGQDWALVFLALGFSAMGFWMLRNFTIFGLFAFVIIARNIGAVIATPIEQSEPRGKQSPSQETASSSDQSRRPRSDKWTFTVTAIAGLVFLLTVSGELAKVYPYNVNFGIAAAAGNSASADFFKQNNVQGPIFNNYDIGAYLIYFLFPSPLAGEGGPEPVEGPDEGAEEVADEGECCKVFVDNRPEAYPTEFFQEVYIPMQEDETVWQEQLLKYDFNTIFFSHRDFTPWGQKFLADRVGDDEWAVVFADEWAIIFLRRGEQNREVIEKFEIPKGRFGAQ